MTNHDLDDGFGGGAGVCREQSLPRDEDSSLVGWIRGHTKIGPREVRVTNHLEQYGTAIQVKSLKNDGSLSWIVISRGLKKYVEEIYEENRESLDHEEVATRSGTEKPVATKHKGQPRPQSDPIDQRKWNDILAVDYVRKRSLPWRASEIVTRMSRHHG